jgi:hypothetical protein
MNEIEWLGDKLFRVDGVEFLCTSDDYSLKTTDQRIVILKDRVVLDNYDTVFSGLRPRTMLEFGIFQGGSAALFSLLYDLEKFVGIDLCPPVEGFDAFRGRHPVGSRIKAYYGVSQTDRTRVEAIIDAEFADTPIDVIIDDASHLYGPTKEAFEIAFPRLKPRGTYVIEDWGWAHWPGRQSFMGKTAMSLFIMELIMLCASRCDIISEVRVFPAFAFIKKAAHAPDLTGMSVGSLYKKRGIQIAPGDPTAADPRDVLARLTRRLMEKARDALRHLRISI